MPMQATTTTPLFAAELTPNRSLSRRSANLLVVLTVLLTTLASMMLLETGIWFILGAMALDLVAIGVVLFSTLRRSRQRELVTLWTDGLEVLVTDGAGEKTLRRFDPKSVRLLLERDSNEKTTAIRLRAEAEQVEIASFLSLDDRSTFARAFGTALRKARA